MSIINFCIELINLKFCRILFILTLELNIYNLSYFILSILLILLISFSFFYFGLVCFGLFCLIFGLVLSFFVS